MGTLDIQRGGTGMNRLLERLGGFAARRHWIVIIAWLFGIAMLLHLVLVVMLAYIAGH